MNSGDQEGARGKSAGEAPVRSPSLLKLNFSPLGLGKHILLSLELAPPLRRTASRSWNSCFQITRSAFNRWVGGTSMTLARPPCYGPAYSLPKQPRQRQNEATLSLGPRIGKNSNRTIVPRSSSCDSPLGNRRAPFLDSPFHPFILSTGSTTCRPEPLHAPSTP